MKAQSFLPPAAAIAALFALSACSIIPEPREDPTRYYSLSLPMGIESSSPSVQKALRIGLRPVEMPAYLKKGVIAVREGESELRYNEFARWAEGFDAGIARLLRDCLEANPKVSRVLPYPFPFDEERDFDVMIRIRSAEGRRAGNLSEVNFVALIEVSNTGAGAEMLRNRVFKAANISWDGKDYASLAKGLSEAVRALSEEILALLPEKKT